MAYTTIDDPLDYFNTVLYVGNQSTNNITGVGFQPDWVWLKDRDVAEHHNLYDVVRGTPVAIRTSMANPEGADVNGLTSFNSDGFTLGNGTNQNLNNSKFVSWNWKVGGSASNNTDGNTTTSVSVNQTAGISIMTWAGDGNESTIGHGLGASPEYIIFKERDGGESWRVWSKYSPDTSTKALALNLADAAFSQTNWIGTISNSIITIGSDSSINTSGNNYVAYAFSPIKGYSKFGSYKGNGNADGAFVYTGFSPSMVIFKNTGASQDWVIKDNKRPGFNQVNDVLYPNGAYAEGHGADIDFVSNGFKCRTTAANTNQNGSTFIYMAFAESPFVNSSGIPTTAR